MKILVSGYQGIGKTTTIRELIKELYEQYHISFTYVSPVEHYKGYTYSGTKEERRKLRDIQMTEKGAFSLIYYLYYGGNENVIYETREIPKGVDLSGVDLFVYLHNDDYEPTIYSAEQHNYDNLPCSYFTHFFNDVLRINIADDKEYQYLKNYIKEQLIE